MEWVLAWLHARQQIANLQRERQRFAELLRDGAAARKQVDDIDNQIQVAEKQLAATDTNSPRSAYFSNTVPETAARTSACAIWSSICAWSLP